MIEETSAHSPMAKPITIDDILNEDIFNLLGLGSMSDSEKEEYLDAMNDTIQARLLLSIVEDLSPEDREQMDLLEGDELMKFFEARGIDIVARMLEEAIQYRLELAVTFQVATSPAQPVAV